jgi:hypothetical protein
MQFYRHHSRPVERSAGLRCDQTILLTNRSPNGRALYVLVAIVKKQLGLELSLYKILRILSVTAFEKNKKSPILEGFSNFSDEFPDGEPCMQLSLFDF